MLYPHPNLPRGEGLVASLRLLRWYLIGSLFLSGRGDAPLREEIPLCITPYTYSFHVYLCPPSEGAAISRISVHLPKVGFSIMHLTASASAFLLPPGLFHLPKLRRFPAFSSHLPKVGFSCREEVTLIFRTGRCSPPSKLLARTRKNRRHGVCWEELGSQCVKVEGCGSWRFLTGPVHGVSL